MYLGIHVYVLIGELHLESTDVADWIKAKPFSPNFLLNPQWILLWNTHFFDSI